MPVVKLTAAFVRTATALPGTKRTTFWDRDLPSFGLQATSTGHKSYVLQYRAGRGRAGIDRRMTIDGRLALEDARREARALLGRIARNEDPLQQRRDEAQRATGTLKAVCENYLRRECGMVRHDDGTVTFNDKIRSAPQKLAVFERIVYRDDIGSRQIGDIKRSEINRLLDRVEDERGPQAAHQAKTFLGRALSWHASREDDFVSPVVRGMGRVKGRERARTRTLSDEEIRDVFAALDSCADDIPDCFARLVRSLFYSATRRVEMTCLAWHEIEHVELEDFAGYVATIPQERMKAKVPHAVPLTAPLLEAIGERPSDAKRRPFVFANPRGERPFNDFGRGKRALDREIARRRQADGREPMPPWQLSRDIRRTAKTLMQRAGVRPDISERCLAHTIGGVEDVYDRWGYLPRKTDALQRLAALLDRITNPQAANVRPFPTERIAAAG